MTIRAARLFRKTRRLENYTLKQSVRNVYIESFLRYVVEKHLIPYSGKDLFTKTKYIPPLISHFSDKTTSTKRNLKNVSFHMYIYIQGVIK